ncbi:uncharacterized protein LOC122256568 [Penaeus japonicus]|uniref:uncharacterized protein LOC122256568 n=1 Tax=Penaeus japonicus TaxID=27405 RepID=UPI001C7161C7|nr:uncharacterized protein LOC122256568 [Penaeus japonicus]XP_042877291.1 uncharacterized protein LOC122256568 [Penaeus japonicus]
MGSSQSKTPSHSRSSTFSNHEGTRPPLIIARTYSESGILHVNNLTLYASHTITPLVSSDDQVIQDDGSRIESSATGRGPGDAEGEPMGVEIEEGDRDGNEKRDDVLEDGKRDELSDIDTIGAGTDITTLEETTGIHVEKGIDKVSDNEETGKDLINVEVEIGIIRYAEREDMCTNNAENNSGADNVGADIDTVDTGRNIVGNKKRDLDVSGVKRGPDAITRCTNTDTTDIYGNGVRTDIDNVDIGRDISMDKARRDIRTDNAERGVDSYDTADYTDTDAEEPDSDAVTATYVAGIDLDIDAVDVELYEGADEIEREGHRSDNEGDTDTDNEREEVHALAEGKGIDPEKEAMDTHLCKIEEETLLSKEEKCVWIEDSEKNEDVKGVDDRKINIQGTGLDKERDVYTEDEGMHTNICKTEKETFIDKEERCLWIENPQKDDPKEEIQKKGIDTGDTGGANREAVREAVATVTEAVAEAVTEVVKTVMTVSETRGIEYDITGPTHEAMKDAMNTAAAPVFSARLTSESYKQDEDLEGRNMQSLPEKIQLFSESVAALESEIVNFIKYQECDDTPNASFVEVEVVGDGSALMRLIKIVVTEASAVLRIVLAWVFPDKLPLQRYDQYLLRDKKMSRASFRSIFNKSQQESLQTDPSGDTFDLFLLCLLLEHGSANVAPSGDELWAQPGDHLEYQLTALREFRTNVFREGFVTPQSLVERAKAVEEILAKILEGAGRINDVEHEVVAKEIEKMTENIASVKSDANVQWDVSSYGETILGKEKAQLLVLQGSPQLRRIYDKLTCQGLVPIRAVNQQLKIEAILTEVHIAEVTPDGNSRSVKYEDLFSTHFTWQHGTGRLTSSRAILLEAPSGFGKTTVAKKLMLDWSKRENVPRDLENFELLIHVDCRNPYIKSLSELLKSMMPDARKMFTDDDVVMCLQEVKTLVLVDGLDDLNMSSIQVVREVINAAKSTSNITLVIMSSPEASEDFNKIVLSDLSASHISILGVSKDRQAELATRLYKELIQPNHDSQEASRLEAFLNATPRLLQEYWQCPLNLVLVASLWAASPEYGKGLKSAIDLLVQTDELCQKDLLAILKENPNTRHFGVEELKHKMRVFFFWLCNEALFTIKRNGSSLAEESIKRLEHACHSVGLPSGVVMANFLTRDAFLTASGKRYVYKFTHKRLQEFYAAVAILNRLLEKENDVDLTKVLFDLQTVLASHNISTFQAQDVLRHTHRVLSKTCEHQKKGIIGKINTVFSSPRETAIVTMLREGCHHSPTLPIWRFQNVFAILLGFVPLLGEDIRQDTARELVLLLQRTGMRGKELWLDVLMNARCDPHVAREMARCIPDVLDLDGEITVRDCRVPAYAVLIKYARPSKVTVNVLNDPRLIPCYLELLMSLSQQRCEVQLLLKHDFLHPKVISSAYDVTMHHVFQWCRMSRFEGQFTPTTALVLPVSLRHVSISLLDAAHYCTLAPILDTLPNRLPALVTLDVLVGEDMVPEALHALPKVRAVHLYLAGVSRSTLAWACECARQLEPENGYDTLTFPRSTLNQEDTELLQSLLSAAGVTVPGIGGVTVVCMDGQTITLECTKQQDRMNGRT